MKKSILFYLLVVCVFSVKQSAAQEAGTLPPAYKFKLGITYDISTGKKENMKKSQDMTLWYSEGGYTGFGLNGNKAMFMIYDIQTMKMITFMEAQKMAMVIDMKRLGQQHADKTAEANEKVTDTKITKTGKKEKILGYNCEQYQIKTKDSEALVWITTELGAGFGDFGKSIAAAMGGGKPNKGGFSFPDMKGMSNGVMLKMESADISSGDTANIIATAVNKEGKELNTTGYKMMSLPGQ